MKLCWEATAGRSGVICEGSPYIYPPSKVAASRSNGSGDGDQREFDLETRVTTNGNRIISEILHSCVLNK